MSRVGKSLSGHQYYMLPRRLELMKKRQSSYVTRSQAKKTMMVASTSSFVLSQGVSFVIVKLQIVNGLD